MRNSLHFDNKLKTFLSDIRFNNRIADLICCLPNCLKENGNYIEYVDSSTISYIPKAKLEAFKANPDRKKYGVLIKIGRFINRFMKNEILKEYTSPQDIEIFVNEFKSYFECDEMNLKILTGSEILKYYREDTYLCSGNGGTLWKSCMRQPERNKFLKLYESNPVQMLVFLNEEGKLRARALLWKAQDEQGNIYNIMDRIYTIYDHDVNFFKNWAKKNGYYTKYEQTAYNENTFCDPTGKVIRLELKIILKDKEFTYYPYLDTFKFFDLKNGILYNTPDYNHQFILIQSNGSLEKEECEEENDEIEVDW